MDMDDRRMMRAQRDSTLTHPETKWCEQVGCMPAEEESGVEYMRAPTHDESGAEFTNLYHRGVHKSDSGCNHPPKCTPVTVTPPPAPKPPRQMVGSFQDAASAWTHDEGEECGEFSCRPAMPPREATVKVKFKIETRYHSDHAVRTVKPTGWRFTLEWGTDDIGTHTNYEYGYGYDSREAAKKAAEAMARKIAPTLLPTETYDFEVEL